MFHVASNQMKISRLRVIDTRPQLACIGTRLKRVGAAGNEGRQRTFYSTLTAGSKGRNENTKPMVARRGQPSQEHFFWSMATAVFNRRMSNAYGSLARRTRLYSLQATNSA